MKRAAVALVLALAASGCGNSNQDAASSSSAKTAGSTPAKSASTSNDDRIPINTGKDGKENVELAETYAKDVCECKTAGCINKAGEKYREASDKMYADGQLRTPTPEQRKKMDDASARVKECSDKLLGK